MKASSTSTLAREWSSERLYDEVRKGVSLSQQGSLKWKSWASVLVANREAFCPFL